MAKIYTDLNDLNVVVASEKGAEIELLHPVKKTGLGYYIRIVGKDSQVFRDYIEEKADNDRRKAAADLRRGRPGDITTYRDDDNSSIRLQVLCLTGWRCDPVPEIKDGEKIVSAAKLGGEFIRYNGVEIEFNNANATKFFSDPGMAEFRKQIDKAIVDIENFIKD